MFFKIFLKFKFCLKAFIKKNFFGEMVIFNTSIENNFKAENMFQQKTPLYWAYLHCILAMLGRFFYFVFVASVSKQCGYAMCKMIHNDTQVFNQRIPDLQKNSEIFNIVFLKFQTFFVTLNFCFQILQCFFFKFLLFFQYFSIFFSNFYYFVFKILLFFSNFYIFFQIFTFFFQIFTFFFQIFSIFFQFFRQTITFI